MNEENMQEGLSLKDIFNMFKAHWIGILVFIICGGLVGGVIGLTTPPSYRASIKIAIRDTSNESENNKTLTALRLTYSFGDYVKHDYVAQKAVENVRLVAEENPTLGLNFENLNYKHIVSGLSAEIQNENSLFITVSYVHQNELIAKVIVENVILAARQIADETKEINSENETTYSLFKDRIDTVIPSSKLGVGNCATSSDTSRGTKTFIVLGLAIGAVAGVAYAIIRELLNNTIRDKSYIESKYKIKVIGSIPEFVEVTNNEK